MTNARLKEYPSRHLARRELLALGSLTLLGVAGGAACGDGGSPSPSGSAAPSGGSVPPKAEGPVTQPAEVV